MTFKQIYEEVIWNLNKEKRGTTPTDTELINSVKLWVNNRQLDVCKAHNFYFMQDTNPDVFTVDGDQSYLLTDFSSNYKEIVSLVLIDGTKKTRLTKWGEGEVDSKYSKTDTKGKPTYYWTWENEVWLYPIPDAVYTLQMKSYNLLSDLSADTDENEITKRFPDVLVSGACAEGARWLQEDTSEWEQKFQNGLADMVRENNKRANQDRGTIRITARIK